MAHRCSALPVVHDQTAMLVPIPEHNQGKKQSDTIQYLAAEHSTRAQLPAHKYSLSPQHSIPAAKLPA